MVNTTLLKNNAIRLFAVLLAITAFFLKWLEIHLTIYRSAYEIQAGCIAALFTILGIWLASYMFKSKVKTVTVERVVYVSTPRNFTIQGQEIGNPGISKRELEVLQLMAKGLTNQEIATHLFISLNTVKTHVAKIFEKFDVKRRTQAIDKARKLAIVKDEF